MTTFYPPFHFGGDAQMVRRLAHALVARGDQVDVIHDVDAFALLAGTDTRNPLPEPDGLRVHRLRSRVGKLSCLATQQLGRPVFHGRRIRRVLEQGFDVIHFHNISLVGGPGILAYGDGIKLYTTHEHWLVCPSHILWRHNREVCTGRECLRCVVNNRRPPQMWRSTGLLNVMCKHVDAFLAPSRFCAEKHREFGFRPNMHVLPNFLPDTTFKEVTSKPSSERPFFLFVGRLEKIKGLQDVIPVFEDDGSADLLIAGTGDYEPTLRSLARGKASVRFLGQQPSDELRQLYRKARAVILPSICYEVFPMVLLEAFRDGAAVIARNLGPYPEIIEQSQGGLLFTTNQELKEHLSLLSRNAELSARLGAAGRRAFQARWSEAVVMDQYYQLIEDLQSEPRHR